MSNNELAWIAVAFNCGAIVLLLVLTALSKLVVLIPCWRRFKEWEALMKADREAREFFDDAFRYVHGSGTTY